ncbi:hypothetical protein MMPV_003880 [Pyropia vietnamensis]
MTVSGPGPLKPAVVTFPPTPVHAHVSVDVQTDPRYSFSSSVPASSDLSPSVDLTPPAPDPKAMAADDAAAARAAGKVDWKVLALILTGDLLGTGLLTVPHSYAQLGWVPATSAITALFILTTYTGVRLHSMRTPKVSSYAGLFHAHWGSPGRVYAAFCVHALLFLFVAGSLQVAQLSWRALFPNTCGAVWVAVVGVFAWIALQARSMPAIGVLGGVSVISAIVPVVVVVGVLREDVLRGFRAPGETSLWFGGGSGGEGGGPIVALMDLLFAFAGHAVFFELMGEMVQPADFPKALYVSQVFLFVVYIAVGATVYATVGSADWLTSPLSLSLSPSTSRAMAITVHSLVILHVTSELVVDGTVFIRAIQRHLQPAIHSFFIRVKHEPPTIPAAAVVGGVDMTSSNPVAASTGAIVPPEPKFVVPPTQVPETRTCQVAPATDWTPPAICWWALWSALTVMVIVLLDLLIPSFDDLIGLAAALIASQTSLAWPVALAWGRTYHPRGGWRAALGLGRAQVPADDRANESHTQDRPDIKGNMTSLMLLTADVVVLFVAAAFLLSGTAANVEDIVKNGTGVRKLFSCVLPVGGRTR